MSHGNQIRSPPPPPTPSISQAPFVLNIKKHKPEQADRKTPRDHWWEWRENALGGVVGARGGEVSARQMGVEDLCTFCR